MINFLQSREWAEFQKSLGRKVWQVDNFLLIKHNLPLNKNYLYSPRLRFSSFGGQARLEEWIDKIKKIAKNEKAIFLKLEFEDNVDEDIYLKSLKKSTNLQPQKTLILNLTKSEQEILNQMHQKTRYNIRLAEKKGIIVKKGDKKDIEKFWPLLEDTAKRGGFHTHIKEYYKKMLEIPGIEIFLAEFKEKIIAANIVIFYNKIVVYLHGALSYQHRNLMAPHLLQWEQIKEAKKRGCVEYDFWGIDEIKWPGVTRFKKGFGGKEVEYIDGYDFIFKPLWYKIYKIARKIL